MPDVDVCSLSLLVFLISAMLPTTTYEIDVHHFTPQFLHIYRLHEAEHIRDNYLVHVQVLVGNSNDKLGLWKQLIPKMEQQNKRLTLGILHIHSNQNEVE